MISILGVVQPYKKQRENINELVSESVVIIILDLLYSASDPNIDPPNKDVVFSSAIVGLVSLSILTSVGKILYSNLKKVKRSIKKYLKKR